MSSFPPAVIDRAISTGTVALAEIGDKTQLLALLLAARFRKPWPIVAGILVATLLNHALAAWLGALRGALADAGRCCAGSWRPASSRSRCGR